MYALVDEVVPGYAVFRQAIKHEAGDPFGGLTHARGFRFSVGHGISVKGPSRAARPGRVGGKALMRVRENFFAGTSVVGDGGGLRARREKLLAAVARIVVHGLNDRAVGANEPLTGLERVLQPKLAPLRITRRSWPIA